MNKLMTIKKPPQGIQSIYLPALLLGLRMTSVLLALVYVQLLVRVSRPCCLRVCST